MRGVNAALCLSWLLGCALDAQAAQPKLRDPGQKLVVRVKKKATPYFAPASDGTWTLAASGPAKLLVGVRFGSRNGVAESAQLTATLDSGPEVKIEVKTQRQRSARLKGQRRTKVTQESAVALPVPEGEHTVTVRANTSAHTVSMLRLLDAAPDQVISAASFPAPAPPSASARVVDAARPSATPAAVLASGPSSPSPSASEPDPESGPRPSHGEVLTAAPVAAQVAAEPQEPTASAGRESPPKPDVLGVSAGVELGVGVPQVVSRLGTGTNVVLSLGYLLPVLNRQVEVFLDGTYTRAKRRELAADERLQSAETFEYTLLEQELLFNLGGLYRLFPPGTVLSFYGFGALRLDLQRSQVQGNAVGPRFGKNVETKTAVGCTLGGGTEYAIGPGAVAAELGFAIADLHHRVTGNATAGGLYLQVGYHFLF